MDPELEQAVRLLLEIAGPAGEHIEISATGPAKYYTVPRPIMLDDYLKHLCGMKTYGAQLRHPEGMTRALAFDTDTTRLYLGWWWMTGAAQHLAAAGYHVLLEPSPGGRARSRAAEVRRGHPLSVEMCVLVLRMFVAT